MKMLRLLSAAALAVLMVVSADYAQAASTKTPAKKFEYTAEQRARIMADARKLCKAKFGPASTVYQLQIMENSRRYKVRCSAY